MEPPPSDYLAKVMLIGDICFGDYEVMSLVCEMKIFCFGVEFWLGQSVTFKTKTCIHSYFKINQAQRFFDARR